MPVLKHALEYAKIGWHVFPCNKLNKKPLPAFEDGKWGEKFCRATNNPEKIKEWWTKFPDALIGVGCGNSGVCVLDLDNKNGKNGPAVFEAIQHEDIITAEQITQSGGKQLIFKAEKDKRIKQDDDTNGFKGIDTRNDGGYFIAPPSKMADGNHYEWLTEQSPFEIEPVILPMWLYELFKDSEKSSSFILPENTPIGNRDDTLFRYSCSLRSRNDLNFDQVLSAVKSYNLDFCQPPIDNNTVIQKVKQAFQKKYKNEEEVEDKSEVTLKFARDICHEHNIISIQDHGRIYIYDAKIGVYECLSSPKVTGPIENLIINHSYGNMWSPAKRRNIINNISTITYKHANELNPNGYINFKNGVLDVKTKKFKDHSPDNLFTIQIPYNYDKQAKSEDWEKYLKSALDGNINKIKLLQEFCGYCFMKSCKYEKSLFLEGGGGAGKSTFTETIRYVLGKENCSSTSLKHLSDPVLRCSIREKYVNFDSDLPEKAKEYEDIFKKITSGEAIKFNEKFVPATDEHVSCKMIFNVNDFPYVNDSTSAFYRRMILVKFDKEFDENNADYGLKEQLKRPETLSAVFNWCMVGLDRLISNNCFSTNIDMKNQIFEMRKENNPILQFIEDEVEFKEDVCVPKRDTWEIYRDWTNKSGHKHPLTLRKFCRKFIEEVRKHGVYDIQKTLGDKCKGWCGISVRSLENEKKWGNGSKIEKIENINWND